MKLKVKNATNKNKKLINLNNESITLQSNSEIILGDYSDNQYDLSCKNMNDRFTTNISNGNGKLKYPIGLLTAGEAYFMGNARNSGSAYWLMSPMDYYITVAAGAHSSIGIIYDYGGIGDNSSSGVRSSKLDVRPVISLKNSTIAIGTGTSSDPYVVETN